METFLFFQKFYLVILIISNLNENHGARILGIFPFPAKSHFTFNSAILNSLQEAGHEITVITSFPKDIAGKNYTIIDTSQEFNILVANTTYNQFSKYSSYSILRVALTDERPLCEKLWNLKEFQNMMNSDEKLFDVIFVEVFFLYKCLVPLAHKMKIPVIGTAAYRSWMVAELAAGNPIHPAYIPYESAISWNPHKFFDRLINTWNKLMVYHIWHFAVNSILQQFHQDYLRDVVSYSDYMNMEPSIIFFNSHHTYTSSKPMNPNSVEVGGIHIKSAKPLPVDIMRFIEDASEGVILFSLGSFVKTSTLPEQIMSMFLEVFARIPQRVIIKYEEPYLGKVPDNVMLLKWLPQRDILEHRNVIAFISHCGQGGVYEAIHTATPVIAIPLMFDQPTNAILLERSGVALRLDIEFVTKETFLKAVNEIINNTRYRENMKKLSQIFKDRPLTPQQSVVYWTDYVIRHSGASHLKTVASELNWWEYLLLDVTIFVVLTVIISLYVIYISFECFYNHFTSKLKKHVD